jgi:hypothetical protein
MKAAFLHKSQLMCFPRNLRTNGVILRGLARRFAPWGKPRKREQEELRRPGEGTRREREHAKSEAKGQKQRAHEQDQPEGMDMPELRGDEGELKSRAMHKRAVCGPRAFACAVQKYTAPARMRQQQAAQLREAKPSSARRQLSVECGRQVERNADGRHEVHPLHGAIRAEELRRYRRAARSAFHPER